MDAIDTDLFWNKKIGKKMALNDARDMVEFMRKEGRAEWVGRGADNVEKNVAWIWWRNPEEWAGAIADWVRFLSRRGVLIKR